MCTNVSLSMVLDYNTLVLSLLNFRTVLFHALVSIKILRGCKKVKPTTFPQYQTNPTSFAAQVGQKICKGKLLPILLMYGSSAVSARKYPNLWSAFRLCNLIELSATKPVVECFGLCIKLEWLLRLLWLMYKMGMFYYSIIAAIFVQAWPESQKTLSANLNTRPVAIIKISDWGKYNVFTMSLFDNI